MAKTERGAIYRIYRDGNTVMLAHNRAFVRHRSETRGIIIDQTQDVETHVDGALVRVDRTRWWRNADTGAIHHIDSIEVTSKYR